MATKSDRDRGLRAHEFGAEAERLVMNALKKDGWDVRHNGDKGTVVDIIAEKGPHKRLIQVKATEGPTPRHPDAEALSRLRRTAHANGATPVVATVSYPLGSRPKIEYYSADTDRTLK